MTINAKNLSKLESWLDELDELDELAMSLFAYVIL